MGEKNHQNHQITKITKMARKEGARIWKTTKTKQTHSSTFASISNHLDSKQMKLSHQKASSVRTGAAKTEPAMCCFKKIHFRLKKKRLG